MAKTTPAQFFQQVRTEVGKVTWPSRRETVITTGMVFAMSILAAIFFLLVDLVLSRLVSALLGFGG
jgi:preprotein translocase subunit SecE